LEHSKEKTADAVKDKVDGLSVTAGPDDEGMTARGVLRRAKGVSQRLVRKIAHGAGEGAGALYINGHPARFRDKVREGDEIRLVFPEEQSWIEPENTPLTVLYEDEDVIVINKQPGMVVHPTKGHRDGTIAGAIVFHMQQRGESYKPRFISRLDMDTSGVLLVGKNSHAQDNLAKQGMNGGVCKYYIAVLEGRLADDFPMSGVIDLPIGLERPGEPRRAVVPVEEGGYASQTEYEVINLASGTGRSRDLLGSLLNKSAGSSRLPVATEASSRASSLPLLAVCHAEYLVGLSPLCDKPEEFRCEPQNKASITVVRARLITGRTHQIRVHFAHYGHPVLGDKLYGNPTALIERQALHAEEIAFAHPVTGQAMRIKAPLPEDIVLLF